MPKVFKSMTESPLYPMARLPQKERKLQMASNPNGKVVRSSNLALRFYVSDGWTKEELMELLVGDTGDFLIRPMDPEPYYILTVGSRLDPEKLLAKTSKLVRAFNDHPWQSDLQFMMKYNW